MRSAHLCGLILLASLAACAGNATTDAPWAQISWGDATGNLQIGLGIVKSSRPQPLSNQCRIYLRNIGGVPIHLVCPPQDLTNGQLVQSNQPDPPSALMTLGFAREDGSLNCYIARPDPPKLVDLKSGQTIAVKIDLTLDLSTHRGPNRLSIFARYYNTDAMGPEAAWTGSIQSPEFIVNFLSTRPSGNGD
jgi:hypothetical protein